MGRQPASLPQDPNGHAERIRRANQRTVAALTSSLAQRDECLTMGRQIHVTFEGTVGEPLLTRKLSYNYPDWEALTHLATVLRPFTLEREAIYYADVAGSLRSCLEPGDPLSAYVDQLPGLWKQCMEPVARTFQVQADGTLAQVFTDTQVADRVLYSQVAHADDAREVLDHFDEDRQRHALAGLVGDWLAVTGHQQYIMRKVRPDIVTELTRWAGDANSVFRRFFDTQAPPVEPF